MGIHLELINYNDAFEREVDKIPTVIDYNHLAEHEYFKRSLGKATGKLILNSLNDTTKEEKDHINRSIYTSYNNDNMIEDTPVCECRATFGRFNMGVVCEHCGTPVISRYDASLQALVWIKAPKGIRALISPLIYEMLVERFKAGTFDTIRWLCDTSYEPPSGTSQIVDQLKLMEFTRGYNNFVDNFTEIVAKLFSVQSLNRPGKKKTGPDPLAELLAQHPEFVFSSHLPIPNKTLMVVEKTNFSTYVESSITGAIDALWLMVGIDSEFSNLSLKKKENRTAKAMALLSGFYRENIKATHMQKTGLYRRHLFGSRANWSFRAVISSITERHRYDEIYIPWGIGMTVFHYHIVNKLERRGYAPMDIDRMINEYTNTYHPLFDEIFKELLAEARGGRIACLANRNPSLARGSIQLFYISKIKTDPDDITVGISILTVKPFNAIQLAYSAVMLRLTSIELLGHP